MSLGQLPLGVGKGGPLNLTPYLAMPPFNTSPWSMMVGMESGFKLSPALMNHPTSKMGPGAGAAVGEPKTYQHHSEHNKFAQSFASALTVDDAEAPYVSQPAPEYNNVVSMTTSVPSRSRSKTVAPPPAATPPAAGRGKANRTKPKSQPKKETKASMKKTARVKRATKSGAGAKDKKGKKKRPEDKRREKRREQNRINAAKCRKRKVERIDELQAQLDGLKSLNVKLRKSFTDLERKLKAVYAK